MSVRFFNRGTQFLIDLGILAAAYVAAFFVRFEGNIQIEVLRTIAWTLPYVVALQYGLFVASGTHRGAWRYVGLPDARRIGATVAYGVAVLLCSRFAFAFLLPRVPWLVRGIIPIGVILAFGAFAFLGVLGVRVLRRVLAERVETDGRSRRQRDVTPTMLIGAGRAGVLAAKEIVARPDLGIVPVGFLDDDRVKVGTVVHNVPVLGTTDQLAELCTLRGAKQALITISAAPGKEIRRIAKLCEAAGIPAKIIPDIFDFASGVSLSRIRKVEIDDLLRREPVTLDEAAISAVVRNRVILVTGAGGSIGSELCRQIAGLAPARLVLIEHSENNLFYIDRELRERNPRLSIRTHVADIRDGARMQSIFARERPDVVFHAAAHKHVPMMELNPGEAVKNNVLGTRVLAELADTHGATEFVMISTDKAVNPTSVMGVSKRAAEIFIQALSQRSKTRFVAVRFGNVLGSAGSVVPIFQDQIARGGPVTVTHTDMTRYFMTIQEACQLVLQAGSMGRGGEIFVLDMGEPVKIVDLARDLIALSGLRESEDIEIQFTGIRPGEKLFEELSLESEGAERTGHPKVFIGRIQPHPWDDVVRMIGKLERAALDGETDRIRPLFAQLVPEYSPSLPPGPLSPSASTRIVDSPQDDLARATPVLLTSGG